MTIGECLVSHTECPWFNRPPKYKGAENGCFSDTDHIVPQRLSQTALSKLYIHSPENKQQLCREAHDNKTAEGDEPLPDRDTMLSSVLGQIATGELAVSKNIKRRLLKGKYGAI